MTTLSTLVLILSMSLVLLATITAGNNVSKGSADTNNVAATAGISMTGMSLLLSGIGSYQLGAAQALMLDSSSNTWDQHTAYFSTNNRTRIASVTNPTVTGSQTFSTGSGNACFPAISVQGFTGTDTTSPFDVENGNNGTAVTTLSTGTVTPSASGAVLFACLTIAVADTPTMGGSGWSAPVGTAYGVGTNYGAWCSYKIQTSIIAEGATFNWSIPSEVSATISAWKAAGGVAATPSNLLLLGCCDDLAVQPGQRVPDVTRPWRVEHIERASQDDRAAAHQAPIAQIFHKAEDYISNVSRFASGVRN